MFDNLDIVEVLRLGAVGLGFLLALLAFFLLKKQIELNATSSTTTTYVPIYVFMLFALVLVLVGMYKQVSEGISSKELDDLNNEIKRLNNIEHRFTQTCEHIRTTNWLNDSAEARKSLSKHCG